MVRPLIIFLAFIALPLAAQQLDLDRLLEEKKLEPVRQAYDHGEYDRCAQYCEFSIANGAKAPDWRVIQVNSLTAMGRVDDALKVASESVKALPDELAVLMLQHDTATRYGKRDVAQQALQQFNIAAKKKPAKDRSTSDMIALGQAALVLGADPKKVIDQYFSPAKRKDIKVASSYLAIGQLALQKADYARAADEFRAGLKEHGEAPDLRYGLAQAFAEGDRSKSLEYIERVLETNPHHEGALVLKAEHLIGAEKFDDAEASLALAIAVNPVSPDAWAYRSVIANLSDNSPAKAMEARQHALESWAQNPQVDHLIGKCLSHAYRFAEAAQQQREVLALAPDFMPAKLQLCHDLMRLGQTDEAWKLAAEIRESDGFNTQAHNLGLLEIEMKGYHVEKADDFIVRLPTRDWQVYGPQALALLREARSVLGPKYGHAFDKPTLVEFFPSQQDFAIRTFGSLGGQGLLGVCFGTVITMNSPGSLAHGRNNWQSTLWHEFCHVVTLSVTRNRMPRWLSEGISVYEEQQRDPAWGMKMNADFRRMILDEDALTPMSQMSSAFMKAKDNDAIMFAYYESSMAVEWLIKTYGWEKFRALLQALATGDRINAAIEKNTAPLDQVEKAFADHMTAQAKAYAPQADWTKPGEPLADFLKDHPNNLQALSAQADELIADKDWPKVAEIGQRLIDLNPEDVSGDSGYWLKAKALHQLNNTTDEAALLRELTTRSSDASAAYLRLIEIESAAKHWPEVQANARRSFALNPFLPQPSEALAEASEALGQAAEAIQACQRLLLLSTSKPAQTRFKLASLLRTSDPAQSKRHLLDALVLAPRYREAQHLLLELVK